MRESWADRVRHREVLIGHFGAVGSAAKKVEDEDEQHPLPVEPPRLVIDHAAEEEAEDPFAQEADEVTGKAVYAATKTVMGLNSADACFITDTVPDAYPWLYLVKWRGSRLHNRLTLWWPGARVEIEGENLWAIYTLIGVTA